MAGDWIKVEKATSRKPEILRIAALLGIRRREAFGICMEFWIWCDDQLAECHAQSVTEAMIDEVVNVTGFAAALLEVGWLHARNGSLAIPNFDRHLSESAKKRALSGERQARRRHANVTEMSRTERDESVTREEKRREEKIHKPISNQSARSTQKGKPPNSAHSSERKATNQANQEGEYGPGFESFWNAYGKKTSIGYARTAWMEAVLHTDESVIIQAAINQTALYVECGRQVGDMKSPERWLVGECWKDDLKSLRETLKRGSKATKQFSPVSECPI